eukprot:Phypoly_transcript_11287.p1 GENE.Phypoly_transcript_11287~~Phypoly_transcript_11287.p1  ORF type:complete len:321 (+),score=31.24 Phypoly_transcript_11287:251-1213(+)
MYARNYDIPQWNFTKHLQAYEKQHKIIYYKTHKTASTTIGNIFFRFGAHHGLRFRKAYSHIPDIQYEINSNISGPTADIALYHHRPVQHAKMMQFYRSVVPGGQFVSIVREPVSRYLSHYYYFASPENISFTAFLNSTKDYNFLAQDFGVFNQTELDDFLATGYKEFFFIVLELLDETLVLLKQKMNWTLSDILYLKINDACAAGYRNFDKKPLTCFPTKSSLTSAEWQRVRENNELDSQLYNIALNQTKNTLAQQNQSFWKEVATFRQMLNELQTSCLFHVTPHHICEPFLWLDTVYEEKINEDGHVSDTPLVSLRYEK